MSDRVWHAILVGVPYSIDDRERNENPSIIQGTLIRTMTWWAMKAYPRDEDISLPPWSLGDHARSCPMVD